MTEEKPVNGSFSPAKIQVSSTSWCFRYFLKSFGTVQFVWGGHLVVGEETLHIGTASTGSLATLHRLRRLSAKAPGFAAPVQRTWEQADRLREDLGWMPAKLCARLLGDSLRVVAGSSKQAFNQIDRCSFEFL